MKDKIKNLILVVLKAALVAALTTLGINTTGCVALGKNPSSFTLIERNN